MPRKPGRPRWNTESQEPSSPDERPTLTREQIEYAIAGTREQDGEVAKAWVDQLIEYEHAVLDDPDYVRLVRERSKDLDPVRRKPWIEILAEHGPCTWEDLWTWLTDSSPEVRQAVSWKLDTEYRRCGELCASDPARCIDIVGRAGGCTDDRGTGGALYDLSRKSPEWLELTWREADRLVDVGGQNLHSGLVVGYFEDVIPAWGPDDPHIRPWLDGDNVQRKCILLEVASWNGLDDGHLREIVQTLTHDSDDGVREWASNLLSGRTGRGSR